MEPSIKTVKPAEVAEISLALEGKGDGESEGSFVRHKNHTERILFP